MRFCPSWYQSAELPQETKIIQNPRLPFTQALVTVTGDRRQQIVDHPAPVGLDLGCQRHAGAERHMHAIDVDPVAVQSNPDRIDQAGFLVSHGIPGDRCDLARYRAVFGEQEGFQLYIHLLTGPDKSDIAVLHHGLDLRSEEHTSELQSLMR